MGLLDIFKKKSVNEFTHPDNRGWVTVGGTTTYDAFKANDYENAYPSISKIANRFMMISPVARDVNNEPVKNAPALEALYRPNKDMSSVDFREALAVMYLVHPEVHILVWSKRNAVGGKPVAGGVIKSENDIAGFTFLEKAVKTTIDNKTVFIDKDGNQYDATQVISLRGAFPYNLSRGFSATEAAKRWTTIDDYIADYQRGFFKNGARPSGLYLITAASKPDYEDTVATIKNKHEGAGNNNKVMFAPRPMGQDGKEAAPKVEFIPISIDNNALDLSSIFEQVNQKIDSAYGVPASIRGVGENNNFATAQQDNRNFVENVVNPLAKKIWTRFTHELNRICGGLGYAITYELDLPAVSEDEKVQAETKAINLQAIISAVNAGYPEENVINALELPESYKDLIGTRVVIEDTNLEVDTDDDTEDAPDEDTKCVCGHTGPKVKAVSNSDKIEEAARNYLSAQVDRAIREYNANAKDAEPTEEEEEAFVEAMLAIVLAIVLVQGTESYAQGLALLETIPTTPNGFVVTDAIRSRYKNYLQNVASSYGDDTAKSIRQVLENADRLGYTRVETEAALRNIMDTSEYRVKRLARTELNTSQNMGKLDGYKALADETGVKFEKTITHEGKTNICPLCASQEGIWTPIDEPLWEKGTAIEVVDDEGNITTYVNDWLSLQAQGYHANCTGTLICRRVG